MTANCTERTTNSNFLHEPSVRSVYETMAKGSWLLGQEQGCKPTARRLEVRSLSLINAGSSKKSSSLIGIKPYIHLSLLRFAVHHDEAFARSY